MPRAGLVMRGREALSLIALISGIAGLFLAYAQDTSAGASIVLVAAVFYVLSLAGRRWRK